MTPFQILSSALVLVLAGTSALSQEAGSSAPTDQASIETQVHELLNEAQALNEKQRYFDALLKINDAAHLAPDSPLVWNMRGSVYTSFRDFDKAREAYAKARDLRPGTFEPQFNLAELDYVEEKYPEAEQKFEKLLADFPKLREEARHLALFKIIVCCLKQDKESEAEKVMAEFTAMDDTPAYYYARAAFAFHKGDKIEASTLLQNAAHIYQSRQTTVYLDSLMEAHWVPSLTVPDGPKEAK